MMKPATHTRRAFPNNCVLILPVLIVALTLYLTTAKFLTIRASSSQTDRNFPASACTPLFLRYEPSAWEQQYSSGAESYQARPETVCSTANAELERVKTWLTVTTKTSDDGRAAFDSDVFSKFRYRNPCNGKEYVTWIEPIVRHFRCSIFFWWGYHVFSEELYDEQRLLCL